MSINNSFLDLLPTESKAKILQALPKITFTQKTIDTVHILIEQLKLGQTDKESQSEMVENLSKIIFHNPITKSIAEKFRLGINTYPSHHSSIELLEYSSPPNKWSCLGLADLYMNSFASSSLLLQSFTMTTAHRLALKSSNIHTKLIHMTTYDMDNFGRNTRVMTSNVINNNSPSTPRFFDPDEIDWQKKPDENGLLELDFDFRQSTETIDNEIILRMGDNYRTVISCQFQTSGDRNIGRFIFGNHPADCYQKLVELRIGRPMHYYLHSDIASHVAGYVSQQNNTELNILSKLFLEPYRLKFKSK